MTRDREALLAADPVGLTQREMLLRLDARLDLHGKRIRTLEDDNLVAKTERKVIRGLVAGAIAIWPIAGFIIVNTHILSS